MANSKLRVKEICLPSSPDIKTVRLTGFQKGTIILQCVVPENIQTPTTEGIGNSREVGGSEAQEIPEGRGVGP